MLTKLFVSSELLSLLIDLMGQVVFNCFFGNFWIKDFFPQPCFDLK